MAWEERGRKTYYYRKVRQAGRVHSKYVGTGRVASLAAHYDGIQRHKRTMARLELEDFIRDQRRVDQAIDTYRREVRGVMAATLNALGFHQHKRQWRLKRGEVSNMVNEVVARRSTRDEMDEYNKLFTAANKKTTAAALERLRDYAESHPHIFDGCNSLASITLESVIEVCSKNEITKIHLLGEAHALKRALGVATATPLERLLIDDVVICMLRMQWAEQLYSQAFSTGDGVTFAKAAYLENHLSATRRRYHQSVETLARVRGLLARVGIQVNIAQQQIVANG